MNNLKTMTPIQRHSQMQKAMQDVKNWAKQNTINIQYLRPFGPGMGRFGRFGRHNQPTPTP